MSELKMGMRCIKYMLFVVNLMFVLTSVLLVTVGTTIYAIYSDFDVFIEGSFFSPAVVVTVIGVLMFFVAFFGCCGAVKESTCMVNTFGVMLGVVFLLEISAAIAAYALQGDVTAMIRSNMNYAMRRYHGGPPELVNAVDFLQDRLQCCGIDGKFDWDKFAETSTYATPETSPIPASCCAQVVWTDTDPGANGPHPSYEDQQCIVWPHGCFGRLQFVVSQSAIMLATGAIAVAFVQLLGVAFAFMLAKSIRTAKTEREARKWQARMGYIMNMDAPYTQMTKAQEAHESQSPVMYLPASPSVN